MPSSWVFNKDGEEITITKGYLGYEMFFTIRKKAKSPEGNEEITLLLDHVELKKMIKFLESE